MDELCVMCDKNKGNDTERGKMAVVGVGSSAGGLDALRALVGHLPDQLDFAVIIAQHMSPSHKSLMAELLSRETKIPVVEVEGGEKIMANQISICPPSSDITVKDGHIAVVETERKVGPRPSIDVLFNSIAEQFGKDAVGIILSGTGSDGAHGSRAIRTIGGLTIAQDPVTAQYDSMPQAAISLGGAELILSPEDIGKQLPDRLRYQHSPQVGAVLEESEDQNRGQDQGQSDDENPIRQIIKSIWAHKQLDFSSYKESPNPQLEIVKKEKTLVV